MLGVERPNRRRKNQGFRSKCALGGTVIEAEYRRIFDFILRDQVDGICFRPSSSISLIGFCSFNCSTNPPSRDYVIPDQVEAGGMMSYAYDAKAAMRRMAMQAAEILNGANRARHPVLQEVHYELVINLKTAKALGLECRRRFFPVPTR